MTNNSKKTHSLNRILLAVLIIAGILCLGVYRLMLVVSENLITRYYLSEEAEEKRAVGTINSFQKYITENSISSDDTEMIGNWTRTKGNVNLIIYN